MPKEPGDFRERIQRDTIRGRYGIFHQNVEQYFYRHWRAFTVPRFAVFTFCSYSLMMHGFYHFKHVFPNVLAYKRFHDHPNYKLMGPAYSYFYLLRPIFWTMICYKMCRGLVYMVKRHWRGEDDLHYTWYYDTLYPDLLHDVDDMRYLNFRYTDSKVTPEPMTGYINTDHMRYGNFLKEKREGSSFTNMAHIYKHYFKDSGDKVVKGE